MKFLLPHRYKKVGAIISPLGFIFWLMMQFGYVTDLLTLIFGEPETTAADSPYHIVNIVVAIVSFLSFLLGLYLLSFSKEKVEDEMVQKTRLDSFQFAALIQIVLIIIGFVIIILFGDPGESGMMLFFIALVTVFWLSFLIRFNYVLHFSLK